MQRATSLLQSLSSSDDANSQTQLGLRQTTRVYVLVSQEETSHDNCEQAINFISDHVRQALVFDFSFRVSYYSGHIVSLCVLSRLTLPSTCLQNNETQ